MKVVIVGGVAGGASAAARLRRLDENAEIVVFEKTGFVSYANCGLPYYVGGVITDRAELTLQTPESFWSRFRIAVKVKHEVTAIDTKAKTVAVVNLATGQEWQENYDKLILAPGAKPVLPAIEGMDNICHDKIFTLRNVEDTFRISEFVKKEKPQSAVIVGGGYIGIELAENLAAQNVSVTIVQRPKQLLNTLDFDMATFVHGKLRQNGIGLKLGRTLAKLSSYKNKICAVLDNNEQIEADLLLVAMGVTPDSLLAKNAGLELGLKGSILVNERMETSAKDVYAVGDAVQVKHFVTGEDALIALAGPANKQGRIAADNICGRNSSYCGSLGSSIIKVFDLAAASTGLTEKAARAAGLDCDCVVLSPSSHASYYPGYKVLTMKVVFEKKTLRLLGAQIIGSEGVDKRIDVLATSLHAGLKADELKDLELSYAPPFSSAKDPVNMAGFMIENLASGLVKQYHWHEIDKLPKDGSVTLLDTRTAGEFASGHAESYVNIPVDELRERLGELDPGKPVYVMCQSGLRSYIACRILAGHGYDCHNFSGGYRFYASVTKEAAVRDSASPCGVEKK